jgi:hypothetical protein
MQEYIQEHWTVNEAFLIQKIQDEAAEIWEDGIPHWLEVNAFLIATIPQAAHELFVRTHLPPETRRATFTVDTSEDLDEILVLPDWAGIEQGVYVNITKNYEGKKRTFTVLFNYQNPRGKVLKTTLFVPPDTQPSIDFMEHRDATFKKVFDSLVTTYRKILFYDDPVLHEVLALAAMSTYFRESFRTYPYMDFQGAEVNSGKTTSMECLVFASFYGFATMDPTGPVLFRAIDNCHASVGIDEIDNLIVDPEKGSAILGILNASAKKGSVAYRTNKDTYQPEPYDAFGMKSFSRIKPIPEALISRSITFLCVRAPKSMSQLKGPQDFVRERDMLYYLRLHSADVVEEAQKFIWNEIDMLNRDRDKWISILTMAYCVDKELFDKIHPWAQTNTLMMVEAQVDDVKRCLVEAILDKSGNVPVYEIAEKFMELLDKYDLIKRDYAGNAIHWQNRTVVRLLSEIGVFKSSTQPREPATGRTQVWVNNERIKALATGTYGLNGIYQNSQRAKDGPLKKFLGEDSEGSVPEASQSSRSSQSSQKLEFLSRFPTSGALFMGIDIWNDAKSRQMLYELADDGLIEEVEVGYWRRVKKEEEEL